MLKVNAESDIERSVISEEVIDFLQKKYSYIESHEDDRLILKHKRIKLVQIMDTQEDREKYFYLMNAYIAHVMKNYYPDVRPYGLEECFLGEISTKDGKLPMFFIYNVNNELLGMAGFRGLELKTYNNNKVRMHELSIRMNQNVSANLSFGYGSLAGMMCNLMAFKKEENIFAKTYPNVKTWAFHFFDSIDCYYIGRKTDKFQFLDKKVQLDVFANLKIDL